MTQKDKILNEIKDKGYLNSFYATYEMGIKQAPTRVWELIHQCGYDIKSRPAKNDSVDWYLATGPKRDKKPEWVFTQDGRAVQV